MNKEEIQEKFDEFLNKQEKETEFESAIKDMFTKVGGGYHDDYYVMLDFLYSLFELEPDLTSEDPNQSLK